MAVAWPSRPRPLARERERVPDLHGIGTPPSFQTDWQERWEQGGNSRELHEIYRGIVLPVLLVYYWAPLLVVVRLEVPWPVKYCELSGCDQSVPPDASQSSLGRACGMRVRARVGVGVSRVSARASARARVRARVRVMRLQSACAAVHAVQPQHAETDTARGHGVEAVRLPRQRLGVGLGVGVRLRG